MNNIKYNIEHNTIEKYIHFIQNCTYYQTTNTAVFYPIGDYYHLFYNEHIGTNANDIGIQFENDGIYKKNGEIYFYVYFQVSNINFYIENIKNNDIILLNEDFSVAKIHKKRNNDFFRRNKVTKSFFNPPSTNPKFYNIVNNIGIIQTGIMQGMYNDLGLIFQKIAIENNKKEIEDKIENQSIPEIKSSIEIKPDILGEVNKKVCKSNTPSFDNLEELDFPYHFIKKSFSSKEFDDYDVL